MLLLFSYILFTIALLVYRRRAYSHPSWIFLLCVALGKKVENLQGVRKKAQFTLLVLVKPPLIKVSGRASCLSLSYMDKNQWEQRISLYSKHWAWERMSKEHSHLGKEGSGSTFYKGDGGVTWSLSPFRSNWSGRWRNWS